MNRTAFAALFDRILSRAAAEAGASNPVRQVELHAGPENGTNMSPTDAVDHLWIDADRFYKIIDVGLIRSINTGDVFFVRPSGHAPGSWSETWEPANDGPFKLIYFSTLSVNPNDR